MRVGIVGAGITGLALCHHLRGCGIESTVFEATDHPGGVIRSLQQDGHVLECGPPRTRLTPSVAELAEATGLDGEVLEANDVPLYVYRDGKLRRVPFSVREAVKTDLLTWRGKLRILLEPLAGRPREDETVESFLARSFGREFASYLGGPLYGGIYASHPGEMPVRHSLGRALDAHGISGSLLVAAAKSVARGRDPPPVATFRGGLDALPRALADLHADAVRLETPVEAIREARGAGFEVEAGGESTTFDAVVLTTPAAVAGDLLESLAPESADALARLRYNPLAVVHLRAAADLAAAGFQVQYDEAFATLGATANASMFEDRQTCACYLGGWKTPDAVEWSDDRLAERAASEFETITGLDAEPVAVHRVDPGMPAYDRSWDALADVTVPDGIHLCANYESRAGIPGRVTRALRLARRLAGDA